jgi:hypothetical protein
VEAKLLLRLDKVLFENVDQRIPLAAKQRVLPQLKDLVVHCLPASEVLRRFEHCSTQTNDEAAPIDKVMHHATSFQVGLKHC